MYIDEKAYLMATPSYLKTRGTIQSTKIIVPPEKVPYIEKGIDYIEIENTNIHVRRECYVKGLDEAYFNTSIKGKYVYVPLCQFGGMLSTSGTPYIISAEQFTPEQFPTYNTFKELIPREQDIKISDLYKNAHCYAYSPELDKYMPVTAQACEMAKIKNILARDITIYGGDAYDRIADYGRLILFLFSKVQLTEQEKTYLDDILRHTPQASQLTDAAHREGLIQDLVTYAKANPEKYLKEMYHEGNREHVE